MTVDTGLRSSLVDGFPYVVFYVELGGVVDVWRVPHALRDIPVWLRDPDTPSES
jgi:plasmid stabilization system protein ParE